MGVPFIDLAAQQAEIAAEVEPAVLDVLRRGAFIGGPGVTAFEEEYAAYLGAKHCVGVANGTDAVELALRAVGVTAGGEVIMPGNTFIATAEAASRIGAVPVPVDVDPDYLLIDPDAVAAAITERTQAIVPVHLFGQVAPVEMLEPVAAEYGLPIVEDAAQSQGAVRNGRMAGTLGRVAATSFYPGKNLGASGDGGAVVTDDDDVARYVRLVANHGSAVKYQHEVIGVNSRLDALHAITLRAKLRRLSAWNACRQQAAARYAELLADLPGVCVPRSMPGNSDIWHLYVIRLAHDRDRVLAALTAAGIGAGLHYPDPWYLTPAYAHLGYEGGTCPVAERAAAQILSLPMFPHLTAEQQDEVAHVLASAVG
jgi:dTDP-4-amino-4,6-dideoxygalactose transaminase